MIGCWTLGYECSMDLRHRKMSPYGTLSVIGGEGWRNGIGLVDNRD
jgi:hypothetical protein